MGKGILQAHLEAFEKAGAGIADERREGYDKQYEYNRQENASEIYAVLNLPTFQMHGVMLLLDEGYQKARKGTRRRDEFFRGVADIFQPVSVRDLGRIYRLYCPG
jgi:hypothetical protein